MRRFHGVMRDPPTKDIPAVCAGDMGPKPYAVPHRVGFRARPANFRSDAPPSSEAACRIARLVNILPLAA